MDAHRLGLRVLVVEDNHLIRRLLALSLESAGLQTIEAESGEDALALARETPPDLWIVDDVMPGMSGSDLVRKLRDAGDPRLSSAPMVGISGRAGASADFLAAGCDSFVAKPVEDGRVMMALDRAVRVRISGRAGPLPT